MKIDTRYRFLHAGFWIMFGVATSYVSFFLQGRGLNTAQIGLVSAVFGILSALVQPILGRLCDRSRTLTWKRMAIAIMVPIFPVGLLMLLLRGRLFAALTMGVFILLNNLVLPFVNAAYDDYTERGIRINFGIARGIGSAAYAVAMFILGKVSAHYGADSVPVLGMLSAAFFLFIICTLPCEEKRMPAASVSESRTKNSLLRRYPAFALMLLSALAMLTSHYMLGTYMLQIIQSLGGDSSHLGTALALQAIVEVPVLFGFSKLLKYMRASSLMVVTACGYILKGSLFALANSVPMVYVACLSAICSYGLFASASVYCVSEVIDAENRVTGQAYMAAMTVAGGVLGNLLGGQLLMHYSVAVMVRLNMILTFIGVATAVPAARMIARKSKKRS